MSAGLINEEQLTTQLQFSELRGVMPTTRLKPIAYRVKIGQSMLLGGLARMDLVEGLACFFTAFVSKHVDVHLTRTERVVTFLERHGGTGITPPFTHERFLDLGLLDSTHTEFVVEGKGWLESGADIVFPGLGWISITGSGICKVRCYVANPQQTRVYLRESLMPYESRWSAKRWNGNGQRGRNW